MHPPANQTHEGFTQWPRRRYQGSDTHARVAKKAASSARVWKVREVEALRVHVWAAIAQLKPRTRATQFLSSEISWSNSCQMSRCVVHLGEVRELSTCASTGDVRRRTAFVFAFGCVQGTNKKPDGPKLACDWLPQ